MAGQDEGRLSDHPGVQSAWRYSLMDSIFNRRSRRFATGAEIPGGPTKYKSQKPPQPLEEIEEALLVQAGTGVSGFNLSDLPFVDDRGRTASGNTMLQFTGRTWASPCGCHGTELFYWNDEGTYLLKLMDAVPDKLREYETDEDKDKVLLNFRAHRIKLADGRLEVPRVHPVYLSFNLWDSNIPGSTIFLPVLNTTWQYINVLLLMCGWADGGAYIWDDEHNRPAGCERWAKEGLLNAGFPLPLSTIGAGGSEVEAYFIMQNLALATQAMGLGGWVHASPPAPMLMGATPMAKGLGFRFVPAKGGRGMMQRRQAGDGDELLTPVGIDGVLEAYCPPYFPSMDAAVDAVVEAKFGPQGLYSGKQPAPFLDKNEFVAGVPRYSDKLVQCVKDICNYIWDTYGKIPPYMDAMHMTGVWVQAHHLDLDFYDRFYGAAAYTETQAQHQGVWHGPEAEAWKRRAREAVAV